MISKKLNFIQLLKSTTYLLLVISFIGLTSCKNESIEELDDSETMELKTFETQVEVEKATESVSALVEDTYFNEEIATKGPIANRLPPDCVTITHIINGNVKTVTLDFGSGCELRNGDFVSGIIILTYTSEMLEQNKTIDVAFVNFYFNDKNVAGSMSIFRERENDLGNPQSTNTMNITVTWPDATFASRQGIKVREWIEGVGSGFWGDNVFTITGSWTFTRRNGNILIATITTPLRRELSCRFIVSGVVELNKNGHVGSLDYGDGTCDAFGTVTFNGSEHVIRLRRP